jgi:LPS sulfotransferase NodH
VTRTRAYVVCSTPRSGSTLLCELLKSTGVAGRPEEYFEARPATGLPPHPGDYLDGLPRTGAGIRDDASPPHAPVYSDLRGLADYREHLDRTHRLGRTGNGVFGAKLMWRQVADLQTLASGLPEYAGLELSDLFDRLFGGPTYVWMRRRDKIRQAISLWRALQTRTWRLEHEPTDRGAPILRYSFDGIDHLARSLQTDDDAWGRYFATHGLAQLTIFYEDDLERDPAATTERVLHRIGVSAPGAWRPSEPTVRQADGLNDQWFTAYHRDAAGVLAHHEIE